MFEPIQSLTRETTAVTSHHVTITATTARPPKTNKFLYLDLIIPLAQPTPTLDCPGTLVQQSLTFKTFVLNVYKLTGKLNFFGLQCANDPTRSWSDPTFTNEQVVQAMRPDNLTDSPQGKECQDFVAHYHPVRH